MIDYHSLSIAENNCFFRFCFSKFNVTLDDRPGGISELCRTLADIGVTIKDIMHERAWLKDIYSVEVNKF